ncbi:hypothetical protein KI387_038429, partial [Taxus chinensis]
CSVVEDRMLDLFFQPGLEPCFDEEKGKMFYVIAKEEVEILDVNHTEGTRE